MMMRRVRAFVALFAKSDVVDVVDVIVFDAGGDEFGDDFGEVQSAGERGVARENYFSGLVPSP
jgi:hypothetical protein